MSIYFARIGRYVKVGFSESPERRVANLFKSATRYGAPRDIDASTPRELIGFVPGHHNEERTAHAALDDFRVMGEWFLYEPEVRDYIRRCLGADDVATERVTRPAGEYDRDADPVLMPTPEERAALQRAVSNIFAGTSLGASP